MKKYLKLKKIIFTKFAFFTNITFFFFYFNLNISMTITYVLSNLLIMYLQKDDLPTLPPPQTTETLGVEYSIYMK